MHYQRIFSELKIENFIGKIWLNLMFAQNIDCGYTLELPRPGGSNKYQRSMFWNKNKKNRGIPLQTPVFLIKAGFKGVYISPTCLPDVKIRMTRNTMYTTIFKIY